MSMLSVLLVLRNLLDGICHSVCQLLCFANENMISKVTTKTNFSCILWPLNSPLILTLDFGELKSVKEKIFQGKLLCLDSSFFFPQFLDSIGIPR